MTPYKENYKIKIMNPQIKQNNFKKRYKLRMKSKWLKGNLLSSSCRLKMLYLMHIASLKLLSD